MDIPVVHVMIDTDGIPRTIHGRIKVKMIVQKHLIGGESVQSIAEHYGIEVADVYASLAYYYDNQIQMDADFERDETLLKAVGVSGPELKSKIQQRLNS